MTDSFEALKARALELKDDLCEAFPHTVCNEVVGLHWDNWCEPCQAKGILKLMKKHGKL